MDTERDTETDARVQRALADRRLVAAAYAAALAAQQQRANANASHSNRGHSTHYSMRRDVRSEADANRALAANVTNPLNQCDGCRRGLPIVNGIHRGPGYDLIGCTADRYK